MTIFEGKHIPLESFKKFQATFMLKTLLHIAGTGLRNKSLGDFVRFYVMLVQNCCKITK